MSEWISVEDRLPEDNDEVLTFSLGEVFVTRYWKLTSQWLASDARATHLAKVTHWMPLPEPPKDQRVKEGDDVNAG